ncbi:MAG: hypothetical protein A3B74_00870 [Candidatus Kerfeldbacteria bacterium RIFCSPHIGHO2_02_FULL_42_14]|uniref:Cytochrome C biogenesis protein transmembrane domain-containing protein n=1 Tax=Candidatus Kerfeldbacteria bacterium RIFCSPHIGHO2_02_FULL_42_14 TaxID=1798540 RepID=A0A1G2AR45_9BACT|nr:MAG: hypothetical protein A3B74_00870 [Candidatus Kerfeldbacteria bacterium RIFCSPHIGHO2_02_FULL_42_14]OGY81906.1 MAG: hypothetical protein A3E60_00950 [Candidatus Kerfeldbacteria bacterium RIFCSPHIGHO2_12_FULL_42_13]OGY83459.1 MAG: hypothetical protein A3I91_02305 [Candidatus Kerfeldbacteria bacterium RIFCSPLOWO2_02_FULL_42_19]OGY87015.1 MAG: hypothetical protein A3G01_01905 [Candidatus Kerfeldbacteria bacterium RIFCSPLOWO2_12_FULL_43_9]
MFNTLFIPAFIAGFVTFFAPCTFPLVPGYLAFMSGISVHDLSQSQRLRRLRFRVFTNGLFYVFGFSVIFILLGSLFGLGGGIFIQYRIWFARIGGLLVIFFGILMLDVLRIPLLRFLEKEKRLHLPLWIHPGHPFSSFLFGAVFALGWTPCIGPILGTILIFASNRATLAAGATLLAVFALGLAVPFLLLALFYGSFFRYFQKIRRYVRMISRVGGALLIFLGILIVSGNMSTWIAWFYRLFRFLDLENRLLEFL